MDFFPISQILKITILRQNFSILFFNQTPFFQHAGHAVREPSVLHTVPFFAAFLNKPPTLCGVYTNAQANPLCKLFFWSITKLKELGVLGDGTLSRWFIVGW